MAGWDVVRPLLLVPAAALAAGVLAGCGTVTAGAAAVVGGDRINVDTLASQTDAVFTGQVAQQLPRDEVQRRVLSALISQRVDDGVARAAGVTVSDTQVQTFLSRLADANGGIEGARRLALANNVGFAGLTEGLRDVLLLRATEEALTSRGPVPEQVLRSTYDTQRSAFQNSHVSIISLPEGDPALAARVAAEAKADPSRFGALAKQYSTDPTSKDKGGDQGTVPKGTFFASLEDQIYAAKPGDVLGPVAVPGALQVVLVQSVTDVPYAAARAQLEQAARSPDSPYAQGLVATARAAEVARLGVRVNPRFGDFDPRQVGVTPVANLLSVPAGAPGSQ